jgi:hypothetical protein
VLAYLDRYTHRVAISNERLVGLAAGRVRFRWRDYADGDRVKLMELEAEEFLRRFLLHVVPDGFVRIRHFGLLATRTRKAKLARCRALLAQPGPPAPAKELKRNRTVGNLDRIVCRNETCRYECVSSQAHDGRWICIYGLDLYNWRDLGSRNQPARGCVGCYQRPTGECHRTGRQRPGWSSTLALRRRLIHSVDSAIPCRTRRWSGPAATRSALFYPWNPPAAHRRR